MSRDSDSEEDVPDELKADFIDEGVDSTPLPQKRHVIIIYVVSVLQFGPICSAAGAWQADIHICDAV